MLHKLNLEKARNEKKLDRFCKEQLSMGDEDKFDSILQAMINGLSGGGARSVRDEDTC